MKSPGWIAFMQAQQDKEKRKKEFEKNTRAGIGKNAYTSVPNCPLCGGTMVLREGKYGQFFGCSRYPNCKGTRKIN